MVSHENKLDALDLDVDIDNMNKYIKYMRLILNYSIISILNNNCIVDELLQKDIITIMDKYLNHLMKILDTVRFLCGTCSEILLTSSYTAYC